MNTPTRLSRLLVLALIVSAGALHAQTGTWQANANGVWSDTNNWFSGTVANGSGNTANFASINITADRIVTLDSARTIGNLIFGDTDVSSTGHWTLSNGGTATNILTLDGGTPTITVNALGSAKVAFIGLELAGTQGITKAGSGTLVFTGSNTYSGGTIINAGLLQVGSSGGTTGNLGSGNVAINVSGGNTGLAFNRGDTIIVSNNISGVANSRLSHSGTGTLILTGSNSYGAGNGFTLVNTSGGRLQAEDTTANYVGNAALRSVLGASTLSMSNNTTFLFRANGDGTASDQVLSLSNALQVASANTTFTINVDRQAAGGGTNKTLALGNAAVGANAVFNVTGSNGYKLSIGQFTMGGAASPSVVVLNPTSANLILASVGSSTGNTANPTLRLDGTSTGNVITGVISNNTVTSTTSIVKTNVSTWTLNGVNTYTGTTVVNAGTLLVGDASHTTASLHASSVVTVGASGTLGGYGVINGDTTVNGRLAPGASAGKLTFNADLTLAGASSTVLEISGTSRGVVGGYDAIDLGLSSDLIYGGALTLDISGIIANGTYDLFAFTVAPTGSFGTIALAGSYSASFSNNAGIWTANAGGQSFTFTQSTGDLTVVPEPGTIALLAFAGTVLMSFRRRK